MPLLVVKTTRKVQKKNEKHENSVIHGEAVAKMLVTTHTLKKDKSVIKPFLDSEKARIEKTEKL